MSPERSYVVNLPEQLAEELTQAFCETGVAPSRGQVTAITELADLLRSKLSGDTRTDNTSQTPLITLRGLSGSGKSTIPEALEDALKVYGVNVACDGTDQRDIYFAAQDARAVVRADLIDFAADTSFRGDRLQGRLRQSYECFDISVQSFRPDELRQVVISNGTFVEDDHRLEGIIQQSMGSAVLARQLASAGQIYSDADMAREIVLAGFIQRHTDGCAYLKPDSEITELLKRFVPDGFELPDLAALPFRRSSDNAHDNVAQHYRQYLAGLIELGAEFRDPTTYTRYEQLIEERPREPQIVVTALFADEQGANTVFKRLEDPESLGLSSGALGKSGMVWFDGPENILRSQHWTGNWYPQWTDFPEYRQHLGSSGQMLQLAVKDHSIAEELIILGGVIEAALQNEGVEYLVQFPTSRGNEILKYSPANQRSSPVEVEDCESW